MKSLGDLHLNVGENDDAKVYYEEALQLCALVNSGSVNLDYVRLQLISIDVEQLNLKSAAWKLGLLVGSLSSELLQKMSSWLTTAGEAGSADPTIPKGLSAGTTDAAVVTGLYMPPGVKLWMEYLHSKYTKLKVVAVIMAKVQDEDSRQYVILATLTTCNFSYFLVNKL